jgi:hypothetical protein
MISPADSEVRLIVDLKIAFSDLHLPPIRDMISQYSFNVEYVRESVIR